MPSPDGLSIIFFKKFWNVVGSNVCDAVKNFFNGEFLLKELNATNHFLIPKAVSLETISHFRPTSLCNFLYKIISKTLANRLKPFLGNIISPNQSTFIPGRAIHDNIIIAHEMFPSLKLNNKGRAKELAFKLDLNKADHVPGEMRFLTLSVEKIGFLR